MAIGQTSNGVFQSIRRRLPGRVVSHGNGSDRSDQMLGFESGGEEDARERERKRERVKERDDCLSFKDKAPPRDWLRE